MFNVHAQPATRITSHFGVQAPPGGPQQPPLQPAGWQAPQQQQQQHRGPLPAVAPAAGKARAGGAQRGGAQRGAGVPRWHTIPGTRCGRACCPAVLQGQRRWRASLARVGLHSCDAEPRPAADKLWQAYQHYTQGGHVT